MKKKLIKEIEESLSVFSRDPQPLFDMSEKLDQGDELNERDMAALHVCANFTLGALAGYLQGTEEK